MKQSQTLKLTLKSFPGLPGSPGLPCMKGEKKFYNTSFPTFAALPDVFLYLFILLWLLLLVLLLYEDCPPNKLVDIGCDTQYETNMTVKLGGSG